MPSLDSVEGALGESRFRFIARRSKNVASEHLDFIGQNGLGYYLRWTWLKVSSFILASLNRKHYNFLDAAALKNKRKSNKVFIFGSGYSLNDLSSAEWSEIQKHDTIGFTTFLYQHWIPVDYFLLRGWCEGSQGLFWRKYMDDFLELLKNPLFKNSTLLFQSDFTAFFCNLLIGKKLLKPGMSIFQFKTWRTRSAAVPSLDLSKGVNHSSGTLMDCINIAFLLGWTEIVLVGVDLYDCRYFYGPADGTLKFIDGKWVANSTGDRGLQWNDPHNTVRNKVIENIAQWSKVLKQHGTSIEVYNPKSLLTEVLPVYKKEERSQ